MIIIIIIHYFNTEIYGAVVPLTGVCNILISTNNVILILIKGNGRNMRYCCECESKHESNKLLVLRYL